MEQGELLFFQNQGLMFNNIIAKGGFGTIYNMYSSQYKSTFALKSIPLEMFNQSELDCLIAIDDPKIVRLYKYYAYKNNCYMLMEYCVNDLEKYIKTKKHIEKYEMKKLIQDVILSVKACHDRHIAHSDIKPSNFLFDAYGRLKIGDFGLSEKLDDHPSSSNFRGTRLYMSPELFDNKEYNPMKADIWAIGVTIYYMVTKTFPFFSNNPLILISTIQAGDFDRQKIHDMDLRKLISMCFRIDPRDRPTVDEMLQSPYFHAKSDSTSEEELIPLAALAGERNSFTNRSNNLIIKPKLTNKSNIHLGLNSSQMNLLRGSRLKLLDSTAKSTEILSL